MTKRSEAKYKIDRRMGQNIWGRPKSPVNRREYGPGSGRRQNRHSGLDALTRTDRPDAGQSATSWRSIHAVSSAIALILLGI